MNNYLSRFFVDYNSIEIGLIKKKVAFSCSKKRKLIIKYTGVIQVNKILSIRYVKLKCCNKKMEFHFVKLSNGVLINSDQNLLAGEYYIQVEVEFSDVLQTSQDTLVFHVCNNQKKDVIVEKAIQF